MPTPDFALIRRNVLAWYDRNKRDLPWRRARDPYAIWIAETMLQQTQVGTVVSYYDRFVKDFPTLAALARAPLHRVLASWSGLGYYQRAENLKKAARQIVCEHGGKIPADYQKLRSLAGIGDYTAGALLSIAFHRRYPAVDGNARRVLGRLLDLKTQRQIHAAAQQLVPRSRPGYFNQGLMELGATICVPRQPRCPCCPVASLCAARGRNGMHKQQTTRKRTSFTKDVVWPLAIVRSNGKILLRLRPPSGLLAKLWELPGGEKPSHRSLRSAIRQHLDGLGAPIPPLRRIGEIRHSITDRRIRSPLFLIDLPRAISNAAADSGWRWIRPHALRRYPVTTMTSKAMRFLAAHEKTLV